MSSENLHSDQDLLRRIVEGDEKAFTLMFNAYYQLLTSFVYRFTESVQVSEEIVQDVFLKIWMTRESLVGVENFKAYLVVVAKNRTINALKKIARERAKAKQLQLESIMVVDEVGDLQNSIIDRAIDQLPVQRKKVYLLARYDRLSYDEIGRKLNLSPKTVKKHMQLAISSVTSFIKANIRLLISSIFFLK